MVRLLLRGCMVAALAIGLAIVAEPLRSQIAEPDTPRQTATVDGDGVAFVGSKRCVACHESQHEAWLRSHHRHAMEAAAPESVLGDFGNAELVRDGERLVFHRDAERYLIRVTDAAGAVSEIEVLYTFGWTPLQQYLVAGSGGRLQAFDVAWDSERRQWFDLAPDEVLAPDDPLHWTGLQQNWNFMCADCHSTGLRRGYDAASDSFSTTWSEITLGCESCHGAGGAHVGWAERGGAGAAGPTRGLQLSFPVAQGAWVFSEDSSIAAWQGEVREREELAVCGPCHAHRRVIAAAPEAGAPLLDAYMPSLLDSALYGPDGRQKAEVYILGSFLQSRMAAAGVLCSDCHDAHSGALKAEGNVLCTQCHKAEVFDTEEHHHHEPESDAAACVACHMPADRYMVVDWRRDHGFHVPGAALAAVAGVVDACASCHDAGIWQKAQAAGWWPDRGGPDLARASALALGRAQGIDAAAALAAVAQDVGEPPILRATALSLLGSNFQPSSLGALLDALRSAEPLVRLGAVRGLAALPLADRYRALAPLIADPVKAVRLEVAQALSEVPLAQLPVTEAGLLAVLFEEMLETERLFLDRPESHYNIANHLARQGDFLGAERSYRAALARDESFVPAYANLAELQRAAGSETLAMATLRRGLAAVPEGAALHYALGLALYRQGDRAGSLRELGEAARLQPDDAAYAYAYALALREAGESAAAIGVLTDGLTFQPNDRSLLYALVSFLAEDGKPAEALALARHLAALEPEDPAIAELVRRLGG